MTNPYRSSQENNENRPPPSFYLFNKITVIVSVLAFATGFYIAKVYYEKDPVPAPVPSISALEIDDALKGECEDIAFDLRHFKGSKLICSDPRSKFVEQNSRWVVCKCK